MNFVRSIKEDITRRLKSNKVIVIYGPRRVGKTVLLDELYKSYDGTKIKLNAEDFDDAQRFSSMRKSSYDAWLQGVDLLLVDEIQVLSNAGSILKFLIDIYTRLTIVVTGSSAIDINNQVGEPLVGRQYVYNMYPLSEAELRTGMNNVEVERAINSRLIYGTYPELYHMDNVEEKQEYLTEMVRSYLLKDILIHENVKYSSKMLQLLSLVAYQVGSEVSMEELSKSLQLDRNTVDRYLDLFTKVFILYKLGGYSKNLRKEVTKSSKWYFYDNGLRNALINDFRPIEIRQDKGGLWENYFIAERIKYLSYTKNNKNLYFWRTYDRQEIDLLEHKNGHLEAFEVKYNQKRKVKFPLAFTKNYPDANLNVVNTESYMNYLT